MHNKRLYKKLMTWLDWIIILLPLIMFIGNIVIFQYCAFNGQAVTSNDALVNVVNNFNWLNGSSLRNCFIALFKSIIGVNTSDFNVYPMLNFITYYCCYIVIAVLIDIVRDLLLLIPMWFNDMIGK